MQKVKRIAPKHIEQLASIPIASRSAGRCGERLSASTSSPVRVGEGGVPESRCMDGQQRPDVFGRRGENGTEGGSMSTPIATGVFAATYGKVYLNGPFGSSTIEITTAITDHLSLISDLEMKVRSSDGCGHSSARIQLSAHEMRKLAALLQTAANRVEDIEKILQQMVDQKGVAA